MDLCGVKEAVRRIDVRLVLNEGSPPKNYKAGAS